MVANNDPAGATYKLKMRYPKFEGMTLLPPQEGSAYELSVEAGEQQIVIIRLDCKGYSFASSFSQQIILSQASLVQKCLAEGGTSERADGIYSKSL